MRTLSKNSKNLEVPTDAAFTLTKFLVLNWPYGGALHAYEENTNNWLKMAGSRDATFSFSFKAS